MPTSPLPIQQILSMLAENPLRIAAITAGLAPDQLRATPNFDGWSANEILAHLRACADVGENCIQAMLAQDGPTIRYINPRSWIKKTDYREQEFQPSLHAFTVQRADLLAGLKPLAREDWSRSATLMGEGRVLVRTVEFYGQWLANHEQAHFEPLERIANSFRT